MGLSAMKTLPAPAGDAELGDGGDQVGAGGGAEHRGAVEGDVGFEQDDVAFLDEPADTAKGFEGLADEFGDGFGPLERAMTRRGSEGLKLS